MTGRPLILLGALLAALAWPAAAQPPDFGFEPTAGQAREFWRYFYFWKSGVTAERARADLGECQNYANGVILWAVLPERLPEEATRLRPQISGGMMGPLVGGLVYSMVEGGLTRRIAIANLRKCMGFKGYRRFGLSEALWEQLNQGEAEAVLTRQARIAAGPEPARPSLDP